MRSLASLAVAVAVAGCGSEPQPAATVARTPPAFKVQSFLPETANTQPQPPPVGENAPERVNDPSAPSDTPLCGVAAREANAAASVLSPGVEAEGGTCLQAACFDPLTDTYIGADGFRHVCQ